MIQKLLKAILKRVQWEVGKQIDALVTASDVSNSRPAPDMIELAKKKFGLTDSNKIIKIGDSIIDIEEGKNTGCLLSIGITTGAQSRSQLLKAKPDYIVDNLSEILLLISNHTLKFN